MTFLVDAQLPPALARWLRDCGYSATAVREMGLREATDTQIWNAARESGSEIITKDEDFDPISAKGRRSAHNLAPDRKRLQPGAKSLVPPTDAAHHIFD